MAVSERISMIQKESKTKGMLKIQSHLAEDIQLSSANQYAHLPQWEKTARSMAYALTHQPVHVEPYDRIIGRHYFLYDKKVDFCDPDLDSSTEPWKTVLEKFEGYREFTENQLFQGGAGHGHITWSWDRMLKLGVSGMRKMYENALSSAVDQKAEEFFSGVLILLDAITQWNQKHIEKLEALNMTEMAELCRKVPEYPAETFHEAVQLFFMQFLMVTSENPFCGDGPGRLDYYLWPYLEKDLMKNSCSLEKARELIDELMIRMDERIHAEDMCGETIVVGGSHANGEAAVNPLSTIIIESIMDLDLTHPLTYMRMPENPPQAYVDLCVRYLKQGKNRAQILNDKAITTALMGRDIPYRDAVEYTCGGCMEIVLQGMNSDYLFNGWHNIPKYVELAITGGKCLKTMKQLKNTRFRGLAAYADFDTFYRDLEEEMGRILRINFETQDIFSEAAEKARPSYLISSMLDDCLIKGRNMHGGGVRYHDYGFSPVGMPNAADALFAVKKAVFDDRFCQAAELVATLEANFAGCEPLRLRLKALPKYGQDNEEADAMARRVMASICRIFAGYRTRWNGRVKPVVLTFVWAPTAGRILGATADGNLAGKPVAYGLTPQSASMTRGITAAINSNTAMPNELFSGGASSMWDLDPAWASPEIVENLLMTFMNAGGQIFQGNITDVEELIRARDYPEQYGQLIVRVGGYSARFAGLSRELQEEVIARYRHQT
jgi:formate C-acetyltransferase